MTGENAEISRKYSSETHPVLRKIILPCPQLLL